VPAARHIPLGGIGRPGDRWRGPIRPPAWPRGDVEVAAPRGRAVDQPRLVIELPRPPPASTGLARANCAAPRAARRWSTLELKSDPTGRSTWTCFPWSVTVRHREGGRASTAGTAASASHTSRGYCKESHLPMGDRKRPSARSFLGSTLLAVASCGLDESSSDHPPHGAPGPTGFTHAPRPAGAKARGETPLVGNLSRRRSSAFLGSSFCDRNPFRKSL